MSGFVADDVRVSGANELAALTRRLKAAGNGGLKRDMLRGLRQGAKPLIAAAHESALENLPRRGGLAQQVADTKFAVRTRTAGGNPGVRIVGPSTRHLKDMDRGRLRHPVFGHQDRWVTQQIKPGWWTAALSARAPEVRQALLNVLAETARKLEHD